MSKSKNSTTSTVKTKEPKKAVKSDSKIISTKQNIPATEYGDIKEIKLNKLPFSKVLSSLIGEKREISRYESTVQKVLSYEKEFSVLSDAELKAKTQYFRDMFVGVEGKNIQIKLDEILPEAFAVVREAAWRTVNQKHYPVQLIGGIVMHEGRVSEMRTGEGKTLSATLAVYLNALPQQSQVHVVTVNDYLARRDASWMGQVYDFLGLTIGVIQNQASFYFKKGAQSDAKSDKLREAGLVDSMEDGILQDERAVLDVENLVSCERKRAYWNSDINHAVDIVYGVNSEYGFDYLRDNMANTPDDIVQKAGHIMAIVDECDSILIDEARTPLIISAQDKDSSKRYSQFAELARKLTVELDYEVDEKRKIVTLTDLGLEKAERLLGIKSLYGSEENVVMIHHLDQALKAEALFKRNKEYVVSNGEIIIVDEFTGRMMYGRRFNQGLHQAIEAKEAVRVQAESKTTATITFQNYFRLYKKLAGMTGTAATEAEELFKIYKLLVVTIPTNKKIVRVDLVDKIFKTEEGKFTALIRDIAEIHKTGQPILIGTSSIEKNELLSTMLTEAKIPFQLLNAKNHEQEARIVSQAGRLGAVTVATNIAGRGVDIKLGGEVPEDPKLYDSWKTDHEKVKSLGGLFVIGTERHESRRVDNQLRGRSGRQGDPGKTQFYISLKDSLLRAFGGDRVKYFDILPVEDDQPIVNPILSRAIEDAQKRIEGQSFDVRKHVTEYDDVINRQRTVIYSRRKKVLLNEGFDWKEEIERSLISEIYRAVNQIKKPARGKQVDPKQIKYASRDLKAILQISDFDEEVLKVIVKDHKYNSAKTSQLFEKKLLDQLWTKWEIYEEKIQSAMARFVYLRAIDVLWTEHLVTIDHLNDSVKLRGYSQKDPLVEFKQDGMSIFISLLTEIDKEVADTLFIVTPDLVPSAILNTPAKD